MSMTEEQIEELLKGQEFSNQSLPRRAKELSDKFSKIEVYVLDRANKIRHKADAAFSQSEIKKRFTALSEMYSEIEMNACGIEFIEFVKDPNTSPELIAEILENLPTTKKTDAIRALALVLDEKKYVAIKRLVMQKEKFDSGTFARNATTATIMQKVQISISPEFSAYKIMITDVKRKIDALVEKYPKEFQEKNKDAFFKEMKEILEAFYKILLDPKNRDMIPLIERDQCAFIYQSLDGQNITENQKISLVGGEFFLRFFALVTMEYEAAPETQSMFTNYVNYFLQKVSNDYGMTKPKEISGDSLPITFFKTHYQNLHQQFSGQIVDLLTWLGGKENLHQWQSSKLVCNLPTVAQERIEKRQRRKIDSAGNHWEFLHTALNEYKRDSKVIDSLQAFFNWMVSCLFNDFNGHHFDLDTERTDENGDTLLDLAIKNHLPETILTQFINLGFEASNSSLIKAIKYNNVQAVKLIRENNTRRSDGYLISREQLNRALLLSLQLNHFEIAKALMEPLQQRESADPKCEIDNSPLIHHLVMSEIQTDNNNNKKDNSDLRDVAVKWVIEKCEVDINQKSSVEGWTVLHVLTMQTPVDEKTCCFVINIGGDLAKLDNSGNSPFDSIADSALSERLRKIQGVYEKHQLEAMGNIDLHDASTLKSDTKKGWSLSRRNSIFSGEESNKKGPSFVSRITLGLKSSSKDQGKEQEKGKEKAGAPLEKSPSPTSPSTSKTS